MMAVRVSVCERDSRAPRAGCREPDEDEVRGIKSSQAHPGQTPLACVLPLPGATSREASTRPMV